MKLAVCDDNTMVLEAFKRMLDGQGYSGAVELCVYSSADRLLNACRNTAFDLIFMDIMLGDDDGISVARQVSELIPDVRVVFITAHVPDFAEKIFSGVRPYGYIGKPVDSTRVLFYIERAQEELSAKNRLLCFRRRGVDYQLSMSVVRYIESSGRQAFVHCGDETIDIYEKLDSLQLQLDRRFVRCHQSYIVNLDWVTGMDGDDFVMEKGGSRKVIHISRNRLKDSRQRYFEHKGRTGI